MLYSIVRPHGDAIFRANQVGICADHVLNYSADEILTVLFPDGQTERISRKTVFVIDEIDLTREAR